MNLTKTRVYQASKSVEIMKKSFYLALVSSVLLITLAAFKKPLTDGVKGWYLTGRTPENYIIGVEDNRERGSKVAYLKSIKSGKGFGTIMQNFYPENYLGKRVRLSGYIKSNKVTDWAGMWFRVDGEKKKLLSFDNMQNRPITGNTDWKKYEIVLDVPQKSLLIAYGVLLSGTGEVWLDDLSFEVVDKSVPVTEAGQPVKSNKPVNTSFEEAE